MAKRPADLLDQIQADALRGDRLADTLRKVVALGGESGSKRLREWANRELRGYDGVDIADLPPYRVIGASLQIDWMRGPHKMTGQPISNLQIPEFARDEFKQEVRLRAGIGELEAMVEAARKEGRSHTKLMHAGASDVLAYMNHESDDPFMNYVALYWSVAQSSLEGVTDQVRTTLVELVAEMRAGTPAGQSVPSTEVADQAVSVAVYGDNNRVHIAQAVTAEGVSAGDASAESSSRATLYWTIAGVLVAAVGVAVAWWVSR